MKLASGAELSETLKGAGADKLATEFEQKRGHARYPTALSKINLNRVNGSVERPRA